MVVDRLIDFLCGDTITGGVPVLRQSQSGSATSSSPPTSPIPDIARVVIAAERRSKSPDSDEEMAVLLRSTNIAIGRNRRQSEPLIPQSVPPTRPPVSTAMSMRRASRVTLS